MNATATRISTRIVAVACLLGGLVACTSGGSANNDKLAADGTFKLAIDSDPGNLNPLTAVKDTTNSGGRSTPKTP